MTIRVPVKLFDYQKKFWNVIRAARFIALVGGRRSGKTLFALCWLLIESLRDEREGVDNVWCAPTQKQAQKLGYDGVLSLVNKWPREIVSDVPSRSEMVIAGKKFSFVSTENPDSLRGFKIARIVFDEAAFQRERAWSEIIRPSLADYRGRALMASTYNGFNWFYDLRNGGDFVGDTWPTTLNPMIGEVEIESMRQQMSEQEFQQEVMAVPTTAKGLVFERVFGVDSIIDADYVLRADDNVGMSIDFGYNDPSAVSFYAFRVGADGWPVVVKWAELELRFALIGEVVARALEILRARNINPVGLPLACDIAGKQTTGNGAGYIANIEAMKIFKVLYTRVDIETRVNLVRGFFLNAAGVRRYHIARSCKRTIYSYTAYEIKDKEKPFADSKHDHFPDGDGYFFVNVIAPLIPRKAGAEAGRVDVGRARRINCLHCGGMVIRFDNKMVCDKCEREKMLEVF